MENDRSGGPEGEAVHASTDVLEVAIVGCGPVGAVLANFLGRAGVRVAVFEREREVYRLPRAVHCDDETMRIFQSLGLSEEICRDTEPVRGYEFRNGEGELLFRIDTGRELTRQGWNSNYIFHQPTLEASLRRGVGKWKSVALHLEHDVVALDERDGEVVLRVVDRPQSVEREVRARYVVGCDGGASPVRKWAGLELEDLEFDEPWLVVDATIEQRPSELGLPTVALQRCDPARPISFIPGAKGNIRWEFMLRPEEKKDEMLRPERIDLLIREWVDPEQVRVIRAAVYDFHALIATRWNTRRVIIAGDAAHQTPPFLGQGMCAGIRDAANLAWKLELVLRGQASAEILESYGRERSPHVRGMIELAVNLGRIICTQDIELARARDASFIGNPDAAPRTLPPSPLGAGAAALVSNRGGLAGQPSFQSRIRRSDGALELFDDITDAGFVLLCREGDGDELSDSSRALLDSLGGHRLTLSPSQDHEGEYAKWFDENEIDAVLIRPDHYVFGAASGPHAGDTLLAELGAKLGAGFATVSEAASEAGEGS